MTTQNEMTNTNQEKELSRRIVNLIEDLIYAVAKNMPFYAAILSKFKKRITEEVPIAAVTFEKSYPVLLVNPKGITMFSRKEMTFILIHEIMHITNMHHFRGAEKDPSVWNIACDIEINPQIETNFVKRPKDALMPEYFDLPEALSAEQYYDKLMDEDEQIDIPEELLNSNLQDIISGDEGDDQNGGSGNGQQSERNDGNNGDNSESDSDGNEKGYKAPGFEKLHPNWQELAEGNEDIQKGLVKDMVRDALNKAAGNVPGEMTSVIEELFKPQVQWKRYLRNFMTSVKSMQKQYTWSRPNRRFGMKKIGSKRLNKSHLMIAIDTSASVSNDDLAKFLTEIKSLKKKNDVDLTIVQFDSSITNVVEEYDGNFDSFEFEGRGGTNFFPVFELAESRQNGDYKIREKPDGILVLTDGFALAPSKSSIPTMWVLTTDGRKPTDENGNTWGKDIQLNK